MHQKKAIVSACLLGEYVRYDGTTKEDLSVIEALKDFNIIPFCPEDPIMGTPRERISVMKIEGRFKVFTDESQIEITSALKLQVQTILSEHSDADLVVLKSKSPSCGLGTTPILNENKAEIERGNGIAATLFVEHFGTTVVDEHTLGVYLKHLPKS